MGTQKSTLTRGAIVTALKITKKELEAVEHIVENSQRANRYRKANSNCPECGAILNYQIFKGQVVAEVCPKCDFVLQLFRPLED